MTLGHWLKQRRKKLKFTTSEVIKKALLDASQPLYALWEQDKRIPNPENLEKLCRFLNLPFKQAFSLWAQNHMPTPKLKALFSTHLKEPTQTEKPETSKTLTIQKKDFKFFNKNPEALTFISRCLLTSYQNKTLRVEKIIKGVGISKRKSIQILNELSNLNYLIKQKKQFNIPPQYKYFYLPNDSKIEPARIARLKFVFNELSKQATLEKQELGLSFRQMVSKSLSEEQARYFVEVIEQAFFELLNLPDKKTKNQKTYWFISAFA